MRMYSVHVLSQGVFIFSTLVFFLLLVRFHELQQLRLNQILFLSFTSDLRACLAWIFLYDFISLIFLQKAIGFPNCFYFDQKFCSFCVIQTIFLLLKHIIFHSKSLKFFINPHQEIPQVLKVTFHIFSYYLMFN